MSTAFLSPLNMMELNCYCNDEENDFLEIMPLAPLEVTQESMATDDSSTSVPSLSDDDDIEMEDVDHSALSRDGVVVSHSYGGLKNLGNTCYMNSGLQMLASLDKFNEHLQQTAPETEDEEKLLLRKEYIALMEQLQLHETVRPDALKNVLDTRTPLFVGYRQQDCHEFTATLLDLLSEDYKKKVGELEKIDEDEQQCSNATATAVHMNNHEMATIENPPEAPMSELPPLSSLDICDISQLLHGNNRKEKSVRHRETASEQPACKLVGGRAVATLDEPFLFNVGEESTLTFDASIIEQHSLNVEAGELSPIEKYFSTEVRACLTCDSCKYSRSHSENFLCLSLDISSDSGSVEEGLRKFFAPEKREIKCEKCFSEVGATFTMEITRLPRALLFHFKRFIVDVSADYSSVTYRKNQSPVEFPETLPLHQINGVLSELLATDVTIPENSCTVVMPAVVDESAHWDNRSYKIRSVVNHIGSSASCGHYTADANRLYPNGERKWTRFNDSIVASLNKDDAMGTTAKKTAYMVVYELE